MFVICVKLIQIATRKKRGMTVYVVSTHGEIKHQSILAKIDHVAMGPRTNI